MPLTIDNKRTRSSLIILRGPAIDLENTTAISKGHIRIEQGKQRNVSLLALSSGITCLSLVIGGLGVHNPTHILDLFQLLSKIRYT